MKLGLITSMLGSSKTHSEEFKEAAEKEKHRKQILNAASRGDEKKLQILLTKYPDIDLNVKVNDVTPLMAAAINGKLSAVKLLLLAKADPYVKDDKRGLTALELARKNKHKDVAEYLLNSMGDQEVFKILKSLGFARYWDPFVTEQITLDRFKRLTDADYDRMGLPIGPRKQIQRFLKELNNDKAVTDLKSPRGIPRSASDVLPSPRSGGRLPAGASAQSAPLGTDADDTEPPAARTISSPQIAVTEPPSPRRHSPPTALSASSPSAVSIGDASSGKRSPAGPKRTEDKASPRNGGKSPRGKPLLAEADRKLMGQYVEYQRAEFDSPETGGNGGGGGKKTPVSPRKKPTAANDEDKNYIYGGVDNLHQQQAEGLTKSQPQMTRVLSDDSSSSDEDDDDHDKANHKRRDESESESESDSDSDDDSSGSELSSDEGPGDERKYGYREIDYEELVFGKKIGAGAFGAVYKGTWRGAPVAIKKLKNFNMKDKHMVEEFRREAKLAELVHNHPNIVKFVGACSKRKGKFCLVTMFCSGGSLDKILLDQTVKITLKTTVRMAVEAASGIYHLHCEGVIHRDIAARNCLVGENFHIFVTDFGFARIKENATAEYARTLNAVGPVKHMSPEAMREKKYSEKSDAFSFGVLMWEMFTRQEPYAGEKDLVALAFRIAVQGHRLTIPSSVPGPVTQLMKDCWETDPHKRPNFKEILKRLSAYYSTLEDTA